MDNTNKQVPGTGQGVPEVVPTANPVLTLITTGDGIPTSTEVTVLTTNLCDVPLMTTSLGTLTEVPIVTTPANMLPSHHGVSTVYTTSIIDPSQVGQAVMVGGGQIALLETDDGMQQTIVVHADPSQLSHLTPVQAQLSPRVIIPVPSSLVASKPLSDTTSNPEVTIPVAVIATEPSTRDENGKETSVDPHAEQTTSITETNTNHLNHPTSAESNQEVSVVHVPPNEEDVPAPIPDELVCIVCYQTFPNPLFTQKSPEKVGDDADVAPSFNPDASKKFTLARFFELTRINMSIVTRRSYKDHEIPICTNCSRKLQDADNILAEFRKLEKDLLAIRQHIKEEIVNSHSSFKKTDNQEVLERRKNISGLKAILDVVDRIRDDIIYDGRPPKVTNLPSRSPRKVGRKPKEEPENISPDITENVDCPNTSEEKSQGNLCENESKARATESNTEDSDKTDGEGIRTSFGRLIKRPVYMRSQATEDDLSELDDSSEEDNYEEIVVKPDLQSIEGAPVLNPDEEVDEEDPVWSPGEVALLEPGQNVAASSDESEALSEFDSEEDAPSKSKTKKETKEGKSRKPRLKRRMKKSRAPGVLKHEDMKYEVKVIQLDGTELMTINTSCVDDNIGLDQHITQKVMDSQAVIMVKNQLYGKRVQCPHCPRTFSDPGRCDIHVKKCHEGQEKPFECEVCKKRFRRQDHMRKHVKRHSRPALSKPFRTRPPTSEKNHSCQFCSQKFRNKSELAVHTRSHTGEKPFKCENCTESFISALKREFHIEQAHPEVPPLRCDHCPKGFFRQHRLRIHAVTHTGEKANICELCGKSFSQAAMLRYHQTTHDELNLKQFKCQECNRVFANPQNLKSHMESQHQKMYRHRCTHCEKGYTQLSHLRRHLRTHTGEKPFTCTFCPKRFTSGAALKIHARIHSGERPFWCSICEKGFRSKTKLGRHMKTLIHSNDKFKKETLTAEIETVDVTPSNATTWTEIVGIISGV